MVRRRSFGPFYPQNLPLIGLGKAWRGLTKAKEGEGGSGEEKGVGRA